MKTPFIDRKTLSFLLYQVHDVESLCRLPYFQDHSKETFEMILDSATQIADKLMFPALTAV
ncbi:MAG: acyl-CoA dehydrogenase N-terminal domain-containing protein, partial [Spirosomataceae bacterium]